MRRAGAIVALMGIALGACTAEPPSSPTSAPTAAVTPSARTDTPEPSAEAPSVTPAPSTSPPEPSLALDLPDGIDARRVVVAVDTTLLPPDGDGELVVTVTSAADSRIDELVLRWPIELNDLLFLAPFEPSEERIRENGPPLVQPWTKWVVGPGERGEPAGTISLGWGPLLPGAKLEIPILVSRLEPGPIAFDLQVLAGNDLLTFDGGDPAELRVEVP